MIQDTIRDEVACMMRRLYQQGLTTCSGGNISAIENGLVYITASQTDKALITKECICVVSLTGENLTPHLKPSMETGMHISIYQKNTAIKAVVHAHPKYISVLAASQIDLANNFTGEQRYILREPAVAPYSLMGSDKLAQDVSDLSVTHSAILMKNHGALCTGKTLFEAFDRMEVFEALAFQIIMNRIIGNENRLTPEQINEIDRF